MDKIIKNIFKKSPWDDFEGENIFNKKRQQQINFNDFNFNINGKIIFIVLIVIFLFWLSSGIYKVEEGDQGAVMRFGRFDRVSMPGLNYHLPNPIEGVIIEQVNKLRRTEIGYRSTGSLQSSGMNTSRDMNNESIMLTGDENVVDLNVDVVWSIKNLSNYVFNVASQQDTIKSVAESAIREVIGNMPIASVLSSQKQEISEKIESLIQKILDQYEAGVKIDQVQLLKAEPPGEVIASYRDVQTARADKEKLMNQAQTYGRNIIPEAKGQASKILEDAEGYRAEVIAEAIGDASRFNLLYDQYLYGKSVTRSRLYLETLEDIFETADKVIMGESSALPHFAIDKKGIIEK